MCSDWEYALSDHKHGGCVYHRDISQISSNRFGSPCAKFYYEEAEEQKTEISMSILF